MLFHRTLFFAACFFIGLAIDLLDSSVMYNLFCFVHIDLQSLLIRKHSFFDFGNLLKLDDLEMDGIDIK